MSCFLHAAFGSLSRSHCAFAARGRYVTVQRAAPTPPVGKNDPIEEETERPQSAPPFAPGRSRVLTKYNSGRFGGAASACPKPRVASKFFSAPKTSTAPNIGLSARRSSASSPRPLKMVATVPQLPGAAEAGVASVPRRALGLARPVKKRKVLDLSQFSAKGAGTTVAPLAMRPANVLVTHQPPIAAPKKRRADDPPIVPVADLASAFGAP